MGIIAQVDRALCINLPNKNVKPVTSGPQKCFKSNIDHTGGWRWLYTALILWLFAVTCRQKHVDACRRKDLDGGLGNACKNWQAAVQVVLCVILVKWLPNTGEVNAALMKEVKYRDRPLGHWSLKPRGRGYTTRFPLVQSSNWTATPFYSFH